MARRQSTCPDTSQRRADFGSTSARSRQRSKDSTSLLLSASLLLPSTLRGAPIVAVVLPCCLSLAEALPQLTGRAVDTCMCWLDALPAHGGSINGGSNSMRQTDQRYHFYAGSHSELSDRPCFLSYLPVAMPALWTPPFSMSRAFRLWIWSRSRERRKRPVHTAWRADDGAADAWAAQH